MREKLKTVVFFHNGAVMAFNESGDQVPELQGNVVCEWAARADNLGYAVNGLEIHIPPGRIRLFRCPDGRFNYESVDSSEDF